MAYLFWFSIGFVFYTYLAYPVLVWFFSWIFAKEIKHCNDFLPPLSIVISVYNEAEHIEEKIRSIYASNYPSDRIEVLVGLDGCSDGSFEVLKRLVDEFPNLKIFNYPYRRGKAAVINDLITKVQHNIIVFTDARQYLDRLALRRLVSPLADPSVGSVSGELVFLDDKGEIKEDIGLYWRYEKFIRNCESRLHSMLGATGALYAMRREFVKPLPENMILDDVYQPFNAIKAGRRAIFQRGAVIYDRVSRNEWDEFERKLRTLIGNFQLIKMDSFYLSPKNPVLWQFLSHKVFRLFVPYALIVSYISSVFLNDSIIGLFAFAGQSLFYILALVPIAGGIKPRLRIMSLPYTFVILNLAAVVALVRFVRGEYSVKWRD